MSLVIPRRSFLQGATASVLALPTVAHAQSYPAREIKVICPLPPGTGADVTVRYFAERLRAVIGKPVIVENRPGAAATIAAEYVARSKPDGHTMIINAGQAMAASVYSFKNLPHDIIRDFTPVRPLLKLPFVLFVSTNSPAKTFADLVTILRRKGDKASYGASTSFAKAGGTIINRKLGLEAVAIPYKATADAHREADDGAIDYAWSDAVYGFNMHNQGKLRILAVTTGDRFSLAPDIPTLKECGVDGFDLQAWWGAWFPAKTPDPIVAQMNTWLTQVLSEPSTVKFFNTVALSEVFNGSAKDLEDYLKADVGRWTEVLKASGIEPQ